MYSACATAVSSNSFMPQAYAGANWCGWMSKTSTETRVCSWSGKGRAARTESFPWVNVCCPGSTVTLKTPGPLLLLHLDEHALFLTGYGERFNPMSVGNWVRRMLDQIGVKKEGSCHLLRHSCATHMLENGADIRFIQQLLGHARLDTTQIYTEVGILQLREVHARTHPNARLNGYKKEV